MRKVVWVSKKWIFQDMERGVLPDYELPDGDCGQGDWEMDWHFEQENFQGQTHQINIIIIHMTECIFFAFHNWYDLSNEYIAYGNHSIWQ